MKCFYVECFSVSDKNFQYHNIDDKIKHLSQESWYTKWFEYDNFI